MIRLLHNASNEIPFAPLVQLEYLISLRVTKALENDLLCGLGSDPTEVVRRISPLIGHIAVLVELLAIHHDLAGIGIDRYSCLLSGTGGSLVGGDEGVCKGLEYRVARNTLLTFQHLERIHEVVVHSLSYASLPGRAPFSQTKTVRADDTSSYRNFRSVPSISITNPASSTDCSVPL